MLTDLDKDYISYRCDAFLQAIDERLDRLERILKAATPPEPTPPPSRHPVSEAPLSIRLRNLLRNGGITYLEELTAYTEADLLRCKGFSLKPLNELRDILPLVGISLKERVVETPQK